MSNYLKVRKPDGSKPYNMGKGQLMRNQRAKRAENFFGMLGLETSYRGLHPDFIPSNVKKLFLSSHSLQKTQFYLVANRIELVTPPVTAKNPILSSHSFLKTQFYLVAIRIELVTPPVTAKNPILSSHSFQ